MKLAKKDKRSDLEKELENSIKLLKTCVPGTDAYETQLAIVERIHAMLMVEEEHKRKLSPDSMVNGAVGLLQVGAILGYERLHNITTKAINFVVKGRAR